MKKTLLTIATIVALSTTAFGYEYQTVREIPGKSASDILASWKMSGTTADFKTMQVSDNAIKFRALTLCGKTWGVRLEMESDVLLEVKDNKYRITFEETRFVDNPDFGMADHKKGATFLGITQKEDSKTYVKCMEGIHNFLDAQDKKIVQYEDF